ncbi:hypothetical protein Q2T76_01655 [Lactobacillus sp. YT155]|uniref:hypothetical protein n=1 Tax=Lactobacillus sp. YT155 TaxID=3060955 RepID=UPI00266013D0|nr:hypothetical protein [Lactobacillus sp. YT155]MDO1604757.1 hypothetical protein [Lactobacillus sp. YT155]
MQVNVSKKDKTLTKIVQAVTSALAVFIVAILVLAQFYRMNKWWINNNSVGDINLTIPGVWGTILGIILIPIFTIIGLALILMITLLPTLLFNEDIYVRGLVVKKYSEEFREDNGYSTEEWYSEDYGR